MAANPRRGRKAGLAALSLAVALALVLTRNWFRATHTAAPASSDAPSETPRAAEAATPVPAASRAAPAPTPAPPGARPEAAGDPSARIKGRFGPELSVSLSPEGRLLSIQGEIGKGTGAKTGFRADDEARVLARAKEILEAVRGPLGADPSKLRRPEYRGDTVSAHLTFVQTVGGVPVAPGGILSLDLGPRGEVVGLYSELLPDVRVANSVRLEREQAQRVAENAVSSEKGGASVAGGGLVVWVRRAADTQDAGTGRLAYDFTIRGFEVVVDAETGALLFKRERRSR